LTLQAQTAGCQNPRTPRSKDIRKKEETSHYGLEASEGKQWVFQDFGKVQLCLYELGFLLPEVFQDSMKAAVWKHGKGDINDYWLQFASLFGAPTTPAARQKRGSKKMAQSKNKSKAVSKDSSESSDSDPSSGDSFPNLPVMIKERNISKRKRKERSLLSSSPDDSSSLSESSRLRCSKGPLEVLKNKEGTRPRRSFLRLPRRRRNA
jgi:hypothetical protein